MTTMVDFDTIENNIWVIGTRFSVHMTNLMEGMFDRQKIQ